MPDAPNDRINTLAGQIDSITQAVGRGRMRTGKSMKIPDRIDVPSVIQMFMRSDFYDARMKQITFIKLPIARELLALWTGLPFPPYYPKYQFAPMDIWGFSATLKGGVLSVDYLNELIWTGDSVSEAYRAAAAHLDALTNTMDPLVSFCIAVRARAVKEGIWDASDVSPGPMMRAAARLSMAVAAPVPMETPKPNVEVEPVSSEAAKAAFRDMMGGDV